MISENDFRLVRQHIIKAQLRITVTDEQGNEIDELIGVTNGGSLSLDANSSVRQTASFSITPTKQITNISEKSLIWLNKNVNVELSIYDQRTGQIGKTWNMGKFLYNSANATYDATTNVMTIELSDWVLKLDGTINGQVGGALTTTIPAYKEDPETGEPLEYSTIRGAIERTLHSAGLEPYVEGMANPLNTYQVDDLGEYYAMPQYNDDWQNYREKHPLWNTVPYDLEFSTACTVWDIVSELKDLYPNYDGAYDENGVFRVHMIPSEYTDEYDFMFDDYRDMVISEQISTELTGVKNICEVWGDTMDADWYSDATSRTGVEQYHIVLAMRDNHYELTIDKIINGKTAYTYEKTIYQNVSVDETWKDIGIYNQSGNFRLISHYTSLTEGGTSYVSGAIIRDLSYGTALDLTLGKTGTTTAYTVVLEGYPKDYRTSTRFATKFTQNSITGQMMRINDLAQLPIIDWSTQEEIGENFFDLDQIHVFQVVKVKTVGDVYVNELYYLGVSQSHAIDVLTDGTVVPNGYRDPNTGTYYDLYSKAYYQHVLNCKNVSLTINPDSPFTVQKLGNRIDVKADGEFSNITSDQLALERAQYENWKNSRLTDNITITTKLMPFVRPYMKIDYKKNGYDIRNDYIVQSVSHDFENGTTTINMYTFYPLYKRQPGDLDRMTYSYMGGYMNDDLYGNQDQT